MLQLEERINNQTLGFKGFNRQPCTQISCRICSLISLCIWPSTWLYKGWLPTYLCLHFFTTAWSFSFSQKKNIDRDCRSMSIFIFMFVFQHFLPFLFRVSLYYKYINDMECTNKSVTWSSLYNAVCNLLSK